MRGGAWGRSLGSRHAVACPLAERRERRARECLLALLRVSEVHVHDPVFTRLELFVMVPLLSGRVPFRPRVCPFRVHVVSSVRRFRVRGCAFVFQVNTACVT